MAVKPQNHPHTIDVQIDEVLDELVNLCTRPDSLLAPTIRPLLESMKQHLVRVRKDIIGKQILHALEHLAGIKTELIYLQNNISAPQFNAGDEKLATDLRSRLGPLMALTNELEETTAVTYRVALSLHAT